MFQNFSKFSSSKITIFIIIIILSWRIINLGLYLKEREVIIWDVVNFYSFVPAVFIHHDYTMNFTEDKKEDYSYKYWPFPSPTGKKVMKTSMGMAFLYTPFFLIGHTYALLTGCTADGFSTPYKITMLLSSIFYLACGLIFLRKLLIKYFSEGVVSITLISIVLGTNLYNYATKEAAMSHAYSFSLMAIFAYLTVIWHERNNLLISVFLGLLAGLISLIRPTNIVIVLFFLLYGISNFKDIKIRVFLFIRKYYYLLIILICAFLVWLPQLLYWKEQTGQYFYYSYVQDEKFFFNNPQIFSVLFSYNNGWLLYSPIMFLSLAGMVIAFKKLKLFFIPVLIFTFTNIWIISSWWVWGYWGSYGIRPMIDSYAILSIPFALTIKVLLSKKSYIKYFFISILLILISYSLFNNVQYSRGLIHYQAMSKKAYWAVFLKLDFPPDYYNMLEFPNWDLAHQGIYEFKSIDDE
jgi:hypothetical protein